MVGKKTGSAPAGPRVAEGGTGRSVLPGLKWPKLKVHPWVVLELMVLHSHLLLVDPLLQPVVIKAFQSQ